MREDNPKENNMDAKEPENNPGTGFTRRAVTAASVAALVVPRHVLGGPAYQAPSDTLRIAGVGVGGMGRRYIEGCAGERIVALCDVDHSFAAPVFRKYPAARVYRDFREMFDQEEKNIDAVIVATPDHNHASSPCARLKRRQARLLRQAPDPQYLRSPPDWRARRARPRSPRK